MSEIDFVITWVDGSDPHWRQRKTAASGGELSDDTEERYRDWDLLRYWFRGVERYAPWVRKIWFICDQEPPVWLNREHPKLHVIRHEDYLPDKYRPAFSSHPIELNMHRIPGLSEYFVYFNDDTFLLSPVSESVFFRENLPVDAALLNPIPTTDLCNQENGTRIFSIPLNNMEYLNRDFSFRKCVGSHLFKWLNIRYGKNFFRNLVLQIWPRFVGFSELHLPQAYLKNSFEKAWEQDEDILDATSRHSFRNDRDVNQWLVRERQLAEGCFMPGSPGRGRMFYLNKDWNRAAEAVKRQQYKMVCLNDGAMSREAFFQIKGILQDAFQTILPMVSGFERET